MLRLRGRIDMAETVFTALFCFAVVFAVLACLFVMVKLATTAIKLLEAKRKGKTVDSKS